MSHTSKTDEPSNNFATLTALTKSDGAGESPDVSQESILSQDLGSIDLFDEYSDWKDDYADSVCVSRHREL